MMIIDLCVPTVFTPDGAVQGCEETALPQGESAQNFTKLFCNSLQLIAEDDEATEEMREDAKTRLAKLKCTTEDACDLCYLPEQVEGGQGPSRRKRQAGPGGKSQQEFQPKNCNLPQMCPTTTTTTTTTTSKPPQGVEEGREPGNGGGGASLGRKKRQAGGPGGGPGGGGGQDFSQARIDFDSEASFIHQLMKVPQHYRYVLERMLNCLP